MIGLSVSYRLKEELRNLIVCLYNPSASDIETQYTFSTWWNYIQDCGCQLERGEKIKRFPYHLSPCLADAKQEQERFRSAMSELRKERADKRKDN